MRVRTPVGRLPATAVIAANIVFWPTWTAVVGWAAQRAADSRFERDDVITRPRPVERNGDMYRSRLHIHRWKDRLPEAGAVYGGFSKRSISDGDVEGLKRFALETRRAEHAHWGMLTGAVVATLWNPWWAFGVNAAVAASSNLPCIAVQRYNRLRIGRVLDAVRRRPTSG